MQEETKANAKLFSKACEIGYWGKDYDSKELKGVWRIGYWGKTS